MPFSFEQLQVYQRSLDFSVAIIDEIERIDTPRKHYRLVEQLEASCTSVALNISEGKGRFSKKEFKHFLYISRGSLYETITMLQIFLKKNWFTELAYARLNSEVKRINLCQVVL
jgi:four helix bundle protein